LGLLIGIVFIGWAIDLQAEVDGDPSLDFAQREVWALAAVGSALVVAGIAVWVLSLTRSARRSPAISGQG